MKTVKQLRETSLYPSEITSSVSYFKKLNIDWDVYLPTKGKILQRDFVWTLEQKRELIWSVLLGRYIPHCAVINCLDMNDEHLSRYEIIDGKQRITTLIYFTEDKFTLSIDDIEYLFSELPEDYQTAINRYYFRYYIVDEPFDKKITDDEKIKWFKLINFAGTPQDIEHLNNL